MKSQHTPGPWTWCLDTDGDDWLLSETAQVPKIEHLDCSAAVQYGRPDNAADAALIAAAPELYEAAKNVIDLIGSLDFLVKQDRATSQKEREEIPEELLALQAAVRQAEGGEP